MADIPGIPMPDPPKRKPATVSPRKLTTSRRWIELGPLVPWMLAYAQWLAQQPDAMLSGGPVARHGVPTTAQRTAFANKVAKRRIPWNGGLRLLEHREDFRAYFDKLRSDMQFRARELMQQDLTRNIEARRAGLEQAVLEHDHREVRGYTQWVTEVAFPKKSAEAETAPRVVIHLGSKDARALLGRALNEPDEIEDVEYEILEPKQLTDGEEE